MRPVIWARPVIWRGGRCAGAERSESRWALVWVRGIQQQVLHAMLHPEMFTFHPLCTVSIIIMR